MGWFRRKKAASPLPGTFKDFAGMSWKWHTTDNGRDLRTRDDLPSVFLQEIRTSNLQIVNLLRENNEKTERLEKYLRQVFGGE